MSGNELEIVKLFVEAGVGVTAIGVLGFLLHRMSKVMFRIIELDQSSRNKNTEALTKLADYIGEASRVQGRLQEKCQDIQSRWGEKIKES